MPSPIETLLATIHALRSPGGCPWDRKQTLPDAARFLLDEAGELLDATLAEDPENTQEELADLLFMICFCCEILGETHPVDLDGIARLGNEKLIRRHPHVFGEQQARDSEESQERWNAIKAQEKLAQGDAHPPPSVLKDLAASSAPLHQAYTYQKDAARVGFDWPEIGGVWDKITEELAELREAAATADRAAIESELGDVLFAVVNLARRLQVQPDMALRRANRRFRARFQDVERQYGNSAKRMLQASLEELESAWQIAKNRTGQPSADESGQPSSSSKPS